MSTGWTQGWVGAKDSMPALPLTMSSRPSWATPSSTAAFEGREVADVGFGGDDSSVEGLDLVDRFGQVLLRGPVVGCGVDVLADVDRDDVGAFLGEAYRVAAALASGGAGNECNFSLNSSCHGEPPWWFGVDYC